MVTDACAHLGIDVNGVTSAEPRMVGLAGPEGAGKSTAAAMVVARENVRAYFHNGVLWLPVGRGAKDRLPKLMYDLASMVYEIAVLEKSCTPPRQPGVGVDGENGAAYIREVVGEDSWRYLVVADGVWEGEVLEELRKAGASVLYTTREHDLPGDAPLRLDRIPEKEAETVLRRAAGLHDDARLPDAAYELMKQCEFIVMDLAFVGRWGAVRGRTDGKAWQSALNRIAEAQKTEGGDHLLPWRTAVLRAGLDELVHDNAMNKELYLSLAVLPDGLRFYSSDVAALLYGEGYSEDDLETAKEVAATLERWSVLTLGGGGEYRVQDSHADFIRDRIVDHPNTRDRAVRRWREHISTLRALFVWSGEALVEIWYALALVEGKPIISRRYDAALYALDPSDGMFPDALALVGQFYWLSGDFEEAYETCSKLPAVKQENLGTDPLEEGSVLHILGVLASSAGRPEEAEDFFRRALEIREGMFNANHLYVARTLHHLGTTVWSTGRPKEAEDLLRRALAIRETNLDANDAEMASTLHNLGVCVWSVTRNEETENLLRRALAIREKLGPDHPDVARTLHDLGVRVYDAGRMGEAEPLLRRALAIREKIDPDHPDVAHTLQFLAACIWSLGRKDETERLLRRALAIREKKLDGDHPSVVASLYSLGVYIWEEGQMEEAEELLRRGLASGEKRDVYQPDKATALLALGECALRAGRSEEAVGWIRQSHAINLEKLGADHPDVARTRFLMVKLEKNARLAHPWVGVLRMVLMFGVLYVYYKLLTYATQQTMKAINYLIARSGIGREVARTPRVALLTLGRGSRTT